MIFSSSLRQELSLDDIYAVMESLGLEIVRLYVFCINEDSSINMKIPPLKK